MATKSPTKMPIPVSDPLLASSYHHPLQSHPPYPYDPTPNTCTDANTAGSPLPSLPPNPYNALRLQALRAALAQGYNYPTLVEHAVSWADDQDPFNHLSQATYPRLYGKVNFRLFESFGSILGPAKWRDFLRGANVPAPEEGKEGESNTETSMGILIHSSTSRLLAQVAYPDCLLLGVRLESVLPTRYNVTTSVWSYRQGGRKVAESQGWAVFWDFRNNRAVDLVKEGGVYKELYEDLVSRCEEGLKRKKAYDDEKKNKGRVEGKQQTKQEWERGKL